MTRTLSAQAAELVSRMVPIFETQPAIRRVYLFGSLADGRSDPTSDLDLGILCERGHDQLFYGNLGLDLFPRLSSALGRDDIDIVMINASQNQELRFAIIEDGIVIFDRGDDLFEFEMRVRHEYEDHKLMLRRHGFPGSG